MLKDAGCGHVILGHSERRALHHESDELVRAKAEAALAAGLVPILCVGESEAEREAGRALAVVGAQLEASTPASVTPETLVVAYEPVWAIGSGRTPSLDEIAEMHGHLRAILAARHQRGGSVRILYGGSVKPGNARAVFGLDDVDGGLIGGASLDAESFGAIVQSALAFPGGTG
jgi:triosephosphate isomerase